MMMSDSAATAFAISTICFLATLKRRDQLFWFYGWFNAMHHVDHFVDLVSFSQETECCILHSQCEVFLYSELVYDVQFLE